MKLRPYQEEAVQSLYRYFTEHPTDATKNPVIAMPTGTGKAVVIAGFVQQVMQAWPTQRIMMLTHVKELIEQNADKMLTMWPQAPLGIYSAGVGEKTAHMPITFAGIQSAVNVPELFGHIDLVIIDECHLVSPDDEGSYKKFLAALWFKNPRMRVIGLSATPYRLGLGMITDGGIFTDVCYDICSLRAFARLIDEGYLSPLIPMQTETQLDVSGVGKRGGEFIEAQLQRAVVRYEVTKKALYEACYSAAQRYHWLIFATGIDHCKMIEEILTEFNVSCASVHSKMPKKDREDNLARFKAGQIRALINANVLTTGFDFPALDCIILLRPTNSPVLHVQVLGRGTRPFYAPYHDLDTVEGRLAAIAASYKQNCLVLDFAGNTARLGPINDPRIPKKKGESSGDIPVKMCNHCNVLNHISAVRCINCGEEFTFEEKIQAKASTLALIARDEPLVEDFKVDRVTYATHIKMGMPPSLKVSYFCGLRRFTEWICLEHHGNPILTKAHKWWEQRADVPAPDTIADALKHAPFLKVPTTIRVWANNKPPKILNYTFD